MSKLEEFLLGKTIESARFDKKQETMILKLTNGDKITFQAKIINAEMGFGNHAIILYTVKVNNESES